MLPQLKPTPLTVKVAQTTAAVVLGVYALAVFIEAAGVHLI